MKQVQAVSATGPGQVLMKSVIIRLMLIPVWTGSLFLQTAQLQVRQELFSELRLVHLPLLEVLFQAYVVQG